MSGAPGPRAGPPPFPLRGAGRSVPARDLGAVRRLAAAALLALLATLAGTAASGPAAAQEPDTVPAADTLAPPPDREPVAIEPLVVTGTRLRIPETEGAYPLTVIDSAQLVSSGDEFVGEFLQKLPFVSGSPLNTSSGRRGEGGGLSRGIATVELRGLGPERTLVLLDGRRIVPGGNGASGVADLNMIPMALVREIEIFKSGASVEYGADAVAGVINLVTREETDGLEIRGRSELTSRGDGEAGTVSLAYGRRADGAQFLFGAEYTDQSAVSKGARDFSDTRLTFSGPDNEIVFDGSSAPPRGNFKTSMGRMTLIEGEDGREVGDFRPWIGDNTDPNTDRFNFNPFEDLRQPSERFTLFGQGRYRFLPELRVFGEAFYHRRDSRTQLAPLPFFTLREKGVVVSADNAFNPFGETITDARRRMVEAGPRVFRQDNEAYRLVAGVDGGADDWFWDASLTYGRNETDQTKTGEFLDSRVRMALGPSFFDASGEAVCGTPQEPIPDCVPLNLFGGAGSVTEEMLDFVGADLEDRGFNEQTVVNVNFGGSPFALPAGDVAVAAGYEYREEDAADVPDPETVAGNTTGFARGVTSGGFESNEAYLEIGVPLLQDRPGFRSLTLDLGGRLVDFSNAPTEEVFEVGLLWQPVEDLRLRGAWSEAFRAPNVRELFGGVRQANPVVEDPCADFSELSPVEVRRCVAQGVPADGSFDQTGEETPELRGGNGDLRAEEAETLSANATWTPAAVPGLRVGVSYYDIEVENGIAALGANTILEQCLATGAEVFCGRIDRDDTGRIVKVEARLQNLAFETAEGLDLDVQYRHRGFGGTFSHRALVNYVSERTLVAFPGADPFAGAGEFDEDNFGAIPRWQGNYRLTWRSDHWRLGYAAQWIGAMEERGGEVFPGTVNEIPHTVYHDLFATYRLRDRTSLRLGVENFTDEQPPFFANADEANTDVSTYRLLGATFWLGVEHHLF